MTRLAGPPALDPALSPTEVLAGLAAPVRQLVVAVQTLYGGHWEDCAEDIRRRHAGRPYCFRLDLPLQDELGWLSRLQAYEAARGEPFPPPAGLTAAADPLPREDHR